MHGGRLINITGKVSPDDPEGSGGSAMTRGNMMSTKGGFNLTTMGDNASSLSDLNGKPNEQLFEMLAEQQEEIRTLKVMLASGQKQ